MPFDRVSAVPSDFQLSLSVDSVDSSLVRTCAPKQVGSGSSDKLTRNNDPSVSLRQSVDVAQAITELAANWLMRETGALAVRELPSAATVFGTNRGRIRSENQDRVVTVVFDSPTPEEGFQLLAVADGLGGMQHGKECASLAIAHVTEHLIATRRSTNRAGRLRAALEHTSRQLAKRFHERGGTTFVGILMSRVGATGISVGDTRLYQLAEKGELNQLSVDDTIAGRVAELQKTEDSGSSLSRQLAQFVGQNAPLSPQLFELSTALYNRGRKDPRKARGLLVTTDGVHSLPKSIIEGVGRTAISPREFVTRLIYVADWVGGFDNASALYVRESDQPERRAPVKTPHVRMIDSFGELDIPILEAQIREIAVSDRSLPEPDALGGAQAALAREKPKSRSRRKSARRKKSQRSPDSVSDAEPQPELDIEVIQHNE